MKRPAWPCLRKKQMPLNAGKKVPAVHIKSDFGLEKYGEMR